MKKEKNFKVRLGNALLCEKAMFNWLRIVYGDSIELCEAVIQIDNDIEQLKNEIIKESKKEV